MKKAAYWHREESDCRCVLCPRYCLIKEGENGFCGVRGQRENELYALTYAQVAASAFDPIEKKPLYHFFPGHKTFSLGGLGCNLRCRHCQNFRISCCNVEKERAGLQLLLPEDVVNLAVRQACKSVVWTYNEPSIWYEYILETAPLVQQAGLKTVLVTAGMINAEPLGDILPHLDAYRLDIKGFSGDFYRWLTGFDCLEQILENAMAAKAAGCHVEIVTNLIPGQNDDELQLRGLARWIVENLSKHTPWHLTAYHPNHELQIAGTELSSLERGLRIGREEGLAHTFIGNISGHIAQNSYCLACGHCLIKRNGFKVEFNRTVGTCCPECNFKLPAYCC